MRKRNKDFTISDMYCVECGQKNIPIARKKGNQREKGHLKKLYCIHCKKETNHCEIRPFGTYTLKDFQKEFELGRFVDGKRIPISKCLPCGNNFCKYNIEGKCWNCKSDCGKTLTDKQRLQKVERNNCDACLKPMQLATFKRISGANFCLNCYKKYFNLTDNESDYNAFAIKCLEDKDKMEGKLNVK